MAVQNSRELIARAGLLAKAFLYLAIGAIVFLAAFAIGGQTTRDAGRTGVFRVILEQPAGKIILLILALGLLSYSVWRYVQTFKDTEKKGGSIEGLASRSAYLFSALTYSAIAWLAFKIAFTRAQESGDSTRKMVRELLEIPYGIVVWAIVLACIASTR